MSEKGDKSKTQDPLKQKKRIILCLAAVCWVTLVAVCFLNRDKISIEGIVNYSPSNQFLAILLILMLFTLKSVTAVIYCGILYAACGIMFPMYIAIPVSAVGLIIMITIPFLLGRRLGSDGAEKLLKKYPKLERIHNIRAENDFFFCFILRFAGRLPSEPLSLYLGASGTKYRPYLAGCFLGMIPSAVCETVMGTSITDLTSPVFLIALVSQIAISAVSILIFLLQKKKKWRNEAA